MAKTSLRDVCRESGVSEATVSRVINNSPLVREATRRRVLDIIERLNYTPNAAARNLSRSRTDTIGVVFHQMSSGFFASVMAGIDWKARENGFHTLSVFPHTARDACETCLSLFKEARVDGLILLDPALQPDTIRQLKTCRRPMVLIQQDSDDPEINSVAVANRDGAAMAMKHLLALRPESLLVITGPNGAQDSRVRTQAWRDALRSVESPPRCDFVEGHYNPERAVEAFRAHREKHGLPRAVFALNDAMALAILKELRVTGAKVPGQVSVMGFDGIDCADYVGLSTVETPMTELGGQAVELLLRQINDPQAAAEHVTLPVKLVCRDTCGCDEAKRSFAS